MLSQQAVKSYNTLGTRSLVSGRSNNHTIEETKMTPSDYRQAYD